MQTYPLWPNLPTLMFARAREWPARPMLRWHRDGAWQSISWGEFARRAASLARGLRALGVGPGDRVLLVSENRPDIPICETALMALRAVPVPAYPVNTAADHAHMLRDSGALVAIVASAALGERVAEGAALAGIALDTLLCMEPSRFRHLGELQLDLAAPDDIAAEAELIADGALACLIYTSGTSGRPAGRAPSASEAAARRPVCRSRRRGFWRDRTCRRARCP